MYNISLSFRIAVNAKRNKILKIISENFKNSCKRNLSERYFILEDNYVEIVKNDDYDFRLSNEDDDALLYYKYNIDFYPKSNHVLLNSQIKLAERIKELFLTETLKAEIISEFEHLL